MSTSFAASLLIKGDGLNLAEISEKLGITPSSMSGKGERYGHAQTLCDFDGWYYSPKIASALPLDEHVLALWDIVRPNIGYLRELKHTFNVSIAIHVKTDSLWFGKEYHTEYEIGHRCLGLLAGFEIPCKVFVTIAERAKLKNVM